MYLLAKYGVQTDIYFPMVKRGVVDLAATADWTPATGDTKVSKDGGAVANSTNNPAIASGTSWKLTLTATELSCKWLTVQIVDAATKAVEDQFVTVLTYGSASAFFIAPDYQDAAAFGLSRLDAAVSSRMATFTLPTNFSSLAIDGSGRVTVGSIVAGAIAAATFAANALGAVWDELRASHTTASTFGQGVASVQGNVTGSVASVTGAVGSVTGAVGSVTGAVGSVTGNVGGNVTGSVGSVTGAVGSVAAGGITASSIAADAIGASELAADGVAEIAGAVWDITMASHLTAGTTGAALNGAGGGATAPTSAQNAAAVWDLAISGHTTAGTFGNKVNGLSSGGSGGPVGSGSTAYTVTVTRPDGTTPIEGVAVWVSTDSAGTNVVAGTLTTDTLGRINSGTGFMLDPGNYFLWRQHGRWTFANPTAITVS